MAILRRDYLLSLAVSHDLGKVLETLKIVLRVMDEVGEAFLFQHNHGDLPLLSRNTRFNSPSAPHVPHAPRVRQSTDCHSAHTTVCLTR
jgi:hypothetical protein